MSSVETTTEQVSGASIQVAGTAIALPSNCRPDIAFTWQYDYGTLPAGTAVSQLVAGQYVEVPFSAFFNLQTSAAVGSRVPTITVRDGNGHSLSSSAPAMAQPASTLTSYTFSVGTGVSFGPVGSLAYQSIPPFAALPRYSILLNVGSMDPADVMSSVSLTVIRVPTGPSLSTQTDTLVATPLVI